MRTRVLLARLVVSVNTPVTRVVTIVDSATEGSSLVDHDSFGFISPGLSSFEPRL